MQKNNCLYCGVKYVSIKRHCVFNFKKKNIDQLLSFVCRPSPTGQKERSHCARLTGECLPRKVQIFNRFHVTALNAFVSSSNCWRLEVANVSIKLCWIRFIHHRSAFIIHSNRSNDNTMGLRYCFRFLRWFQILCNVTFPLFRYPFRAMNGSYGTYGVFELEKTNHRTWLWNFKKEKKWKSCVAAVASAINRCWRKSAQLQNRVRIYLLFASGTRRSAFTAQSQLYHFLASRVNLQHLSKWHNTWAACTCTVHTTETYENSLNNRFAYMWRAANAMDCLVDVIILLYKSQKCI